jgi:hypothetical protein
MLRRLVLVRTDVSEERSASFIRMTRIGELGTTLAVTSNRRTLRSNTWWGGANFLETSVLTRATRHNIPEDTTLYLQLYTCSSNSLMLWNRRHKNAQTSTLSTSVANCSWGFARSLQFNVELRLNRPTSFSSVHTGINISHMSTHNNCTCPNIIKYSTNLGCSSTS